MAQGGKTEPMTDRAPKELSDRELAFDLILVSGAVPSESPDREWQVAVIQEAAGRLDPKKWGEGTAAEEKPSRTEEPAP